MPIAYIREKEATTFCHVMVIDYLFLLHIQFSASKTYNQWTDTFLSEKRLVDEIYMNNIL